MSDPRLQLSERDRQSLLQGNRELCESLDRLPYDLLDADGLLRKTAEQTKRALSIIDVPLAKLDATEADWEASRQQLIELHRETV